VIVDELLIQPMTVFTIGTRSPSAPASTVGEEPGQHHDQRHQRGDHLHRQLQQRNDQLG
jgi:hypothetical protein